MRFLFIDRILSIKRNEEIVALKLVPLSEDYFAEHFPGNPIMPGSLLIEAMAQAGTALLEISRNHTVKAMPIIVEQVKFREIVRPGDSLTITMTVRADRDSLLNLEGTIRRDRRAVATGKMTFVLKPAGEIYLPIARTIMESLYRNLLDGAEMEGFDEGDNA